MSDNTTCRWPWICSNTNTLVGCHEHVGLIYIRRRGTLCSLFLGSKSTGEPIESLCLFCQWDFFRFFSSSSSSSPIICKYFSGRPRLGREVCRLIRWGHKEADTLRWWLISLPLSQYKTFHTWCLREMLGVLSIRASCRSGRVGSTKEDWKMNWDRWERK